MATGAYPWIVAMATAILVCRGTHGSVTIVDPESGYKTAAVGEFVTFRCLDPDGNELEWTVDTELGELVLEDSPPIILTSQVTADGYELLLTIEGVTKEDSLVYTCRAKTDPDNKQTVTLTVGSSDLPAGWVPPMIIRREGQTTIEFEVGKELRLKCEGGSKDSVLEFRHDGDVINTDTHNLMTSATDVAHNRATVILSRDPAITDYSGTYSCHDVAHPEPSDSVKVDVLEHPSTRVEIIEPSGTQTKVLVGDTFSLTCQSSDQTTMIWYHDQDEIEDQEAGFLIMVKEDVVQHTRTSFLSKDDAQPEDAGTYRCVNADSPEEEATIRVDVKAEGDAGDDDIDDDNDDDDDDGGVDDDDDDDGFLGSLFGGAPSRWSYHALLILVAAAIAAF